MAFLLGFFDGDGKEGKTSFHLGSKMVLDQIKEKFGGLRFYARTPTGTRYEIRGMIQMAEAMSVTICDSCGNKGKTRNHAWRRTLCDKCEKKQNKGKRFEGLKNLK